MDFTRARRTQHLIGINPFTISRIKLYEPKEVILEFYKWNINSLSKKEKVRK